MKKAMKKVLVGMCLGLVCATAAMSDNKLTEKDIVVSYDNFTIAYIEKSKSCKTLDGSLALAFFKDYKEGSLMISGQVIKWDNGSIFFSAVKEIEEKVFVFDFFNNMKMCEEYKKIVNTPEDKKK